MTQMQQATGDANFREKVFRQVKKIPKGKVSTYGQVALLLGKPRGAREVGWMLHSNDRVDVPCHRVVGSNGDLVGFAHGLKKKTEMLKSEGVEVKNGKVDLKKHGYNF